MRVVRVERTVGRCDSRQQGERTSQQLWAVGAGVEGDGERGLGAKSVRGLVFTGNRLGVNHRAAYWQQGQLFRKLDIYLDLQ